MVTHQGQSGCQQRDGQVPLRIGPGELVDQAEVTVGVTTVRSPGTKGLIAEHQADWENGDWHAWIGGRSEGKSGPWKSPYHNGRAVIRCLELLEELGKL